MFRSAPRRRTALSWGGGQGPKAINRMNLLVNSVLVLLVLDATVGDWLLHDYQSLQFAKVGHVTDSSAKISLRVPGCDGVDLCYAPVDSGNAFQCNVVKMEQEMIAQQDYIVNTLLEDLAPNTDYHYKVTDPRHDSSQFIAEGFFKTANSNGQKWSFLASSCIIPNFPYNPVHRNRFLGWEHLYKQEISDTKALDLPAFMVFLGDFIYYDLPFYPRFSTAAYFKKYRSVYASPSFRKVYEKLPFLHVYDDHDVVNNFDSREKSVPYPMAHDAFMAYHGSSNPDPLRADQTWYAFQRGGLDFFMLDTRRYRSKNKVHDNTDKTMLGSEQLQDLLQWLRKPANGAMRVVISSIPFTENWKGVDGHLDTWGGFLTERQTIMEVVEATSQVILVISGDRHEFAATDISTGGAGRIIDISISPLNQFYLPVPTYSSHINDTMINYTPRGNVKWGKFLVDSTGPSTRVDFELYVDGNPDPAWTYAIPGSSNS